MDEPRYVEARSLPVSFEEYRRQVHAFVRARPGEEQAPVVVHLLDGHVLMESFTLLLNERLFFKKGIASVELLTPVFYEEKMHQAAAQQGDYAPLSASQNLDFQRDGPQLKLKIPKLEHHWGILVVHPK